MVRMRSSRLLLLSVTLILVTCAFQVEVKDEKVVIKASKSELDKTKRVKTMVKADPKVKVTVLIVGGGRYQHFSRVNGI